MIPASIRRLLRKQAHVSTPVRGLVVGLVVAIMLTFCISWYAQRLMADLQALAEPTPMVPVTRNVMVGSDSKLLAKRWRDFAAAKPNEQPVFEISGDDLQTLARERTKVADTLAIKIEKGRTVVRLAYPLSAVPLIGGTLGPNYVNLFAVGDPKIVEGRPAFVLRSVVCKGERIEGQRLEWLQSLTNAWLRTNLAGSADALRQVKKIDQEPSVLLLHK